MGRLTIDMLRRRAEHNEGCLSNLKEVALHQQDIERIEVVGDACRQLEILYLCNNYIGKIEGLRHLKWLKYLNLAVNNITRIEGLEGCESLERLDLTLNFIADLSTVSNLLANPFLETLHLTGNPCGKIPGYRAFVIHTLPQLHDLDGEEIVKSERITARQSEQSVVEVVNEEVLRAREAERIKSEMIAKGIDPFPPKYNEQGERVYGHTPEERLQMLREQQEAEAAKRKAESEPAPGSISALHKELNAKRKPLTPEEEVARYGRLLLRNEGKVPFTMDQDAPDALTVTVEPGKFISTTLLNVQVDVNCVRVYIKDKLLQVPTDLELAPDQARVQRSSTTGQLKVTVPYTPAVQESRRGLRGRLEAMAREDRACTDAEAAAATSGARSSEKHRMAPPQRNALLTVERPSAAAAPEAASPPAAPPQQRTMVTEVASRDAESLNTVEAGAGADCSAAQGAASLLELD